MANALIAQMLYLVFVIVKHDYDLEVIFSYNGKEISQLERSTLNVRKAIAWVLNYIEMGKTC